MKARVMERTARGKIFMIFGTVLVAVTLAAAVNAWPADLAVGNNAPDFSAFTVAGEKLSLHQLKGKTVFLAFWSSWCSTSREELAWLKKISDLYPSIVFLVVNSETETTGIKSLAFMRQIVEEWDLPVVIVVDRGRKIWNEYQIHDLPTSIIISNNGNIEFLETNFFWASADKFRGILNNMEGVSLNTP